MSKRTAWRRLQDPDVIELIGEVELERRASLLDWSRMVRSLADLVTDAVVHVLEDDPAPSTVARLASVVLPEVRHLAEPVDLATRLDALEAKLADLSVTGLGRVVGL